VERAEGWSSVDRHGPGESADRSGPWECHRCRPPGGCSHHLRVGWGVVVGMVGVMAVMVMPMVEVMAVTVTTRMTALGRTAMTRRRRLRMEMPTEAAGTVRGGRVTLGTLVRVSVPVGPRARLVPRDGGYPGGLGDVEMARSRWAPSPIGGPE
jgi:hypothetical protein